MAAGKPKAAKEGAQARGAKRVPLGAALNWSEAELDALAAVTPGEIATAQTRWRQDAPEAAKTLLDAEPRENAEPS